jgi:GWxTD domain-containing protein
LIKKILFFLLLIILSGLGYAQPEIPLLLYSDFIQIPTDSSSTVFYTYKIPLNRLVFEKEADLFLAQYRMSIEVFDSADTKFITRGIREKNIQVPDYDQTKSPLIFSEGVLVLNLKPGIYSVMEILYDYKSNREMKLPLYKMKVDTIDKFISPLIIDEQTIECNERISPVLANYSGKLPFDENKYTFMLPVNDDNIDTLYVSIVQNKDTLYNGMLTGPIKERLSFRECAGKILVDDSEDNQVYNIFRIDGLSHRIKEGGFLIDVSANPGHLNQKKFPIECKWINKPRSLKDPELAIKALKFIEQDSVISSLLKGDDEEYNRNLSSYWQSIDPTPRTQFNPLMQEFYTRIDYAVKNFAAIGGTNGANTDRGKVYIKFGKPVDINRTSDDHGNIIETWTYSNPQRKFVFVDTKGTGDFSLISG